MKMFSIVGKEIYFYGYFSIDSAITGALDLTSEAQVQFPRYPQKLSSYFEN